MTKDNITKLNRLFKSWPRGAVYTTAYLRQMGYSNNLIQHYKNKLWLEPIGRGAYKIHEDKVDWYGGVFALQKQLGLSVHVGAKTSLALQGNAHYLPMSGHLPLCTLFGRRGEKLPAWFREGDWHTKIVYKPTKLFPNDLDDTFKDFTHREFSIRISSPERASIEMCHLVPHRQGFDETEKIMENLATLRPKVIQSLLEQCHFIKVKRLFLYFADKVNHAWFHDLNLTEINLGSGERQIVDKGVLDKKYLITVPKR